jgi:hypothetical protein
VLHCVNKYGLTKESYHALILGPSPGLAQLPLLFGEEYKLHQQTPDEDLKRLE